MIADLWIPEERGLSLAIYTLTPLLGPAIGPITAGLLIQHASWPWIFISTSIFTAISLFIGVFTLRETFAPVLLKRKRVALGGDESELSVSKALHKLWTTDLRRPLVLLGTQPTIQVLAVFMGYLFGLNYLTISNFQALWERKYGQPANIASLNYVSIALGFVLGCEIAGPLNDKVCSQQHDFILLQNSFHFINASWQDL